MSAPVQIPDQDEKLAEVSSEVSAVVARAHQIEVTSESQAQEATGFLGEIKAAKTRSERARKFIVDPFNAQVRKINERFKEAAVPLDEADRLVRGKVLRFRQEQERIREREQARLDAERNAAEEAAAAERQRAEAAAACAEREACEFIRFERCLNCGHSSDDHRLDDAANHDPTDPDAPFRCVIATCDCRAFVLAETAEADLAQRQRRADTARRAAEEALQASIATQATPPLAVAAPAPLAAENGSASVRHRWVATVINELSVPRQYLKVNMAAINAAVRSGVREIPGIEITREAELAVRAR